MEVVRELLKYSAVGEIHCVSPDKTVGQIWKDLFPLNDSRVHLHWCDGRKFVKEYRANPFDLVLVDCWSAVNCSYQ